MFQGLPKGLIKFKKDDFKLIYLKKIILPISLLIFIVSATILIHKHISLDFLNTKNILIIFAIISLIYSLYVILFTNEKNNHSSKKRNITLLTDNSIEFDNGVCAKLKKIKWSISKNKNLTVEDYQYHFKEFCNQSNKRIKPIKNMIEEYSFTSSFSMALIGKWGSGKSSYLKTLEKELKQKYEIISINVWQLENSENITNELKKELDNIIFRYNKSIWLLQIFRRLFVQDYFSIVSKYLTKTPIKSSFTFEPTLKESKETLHTQLTEALNGKKIILLIDELDRINSEDEILNIFKIIHYTNDFDNIFTITAMDIEQLENRLEDIDYIHKIFNLKYLLPSIDKNEIIQYYEDIIFEKSKNHIKESEFKEILKTSSVINAISNYRIIKNTFNDTMVFISGLQKEHPTDWDKYISFKFIFILNLIKAVDFKFYSFMVINKKIFILMKMSEIQAKENQTKREQEEIFLKQEPLLEEIYKSLNFRKLLNLLSILRREWKKEQFFDIYQSHTIEKYHITDSRYESFIKKPKEFQNYFDEFHFEQDKSKFLLNILNRLSAKKEHQKILLATVVNIILSMDESILRKESSSGYNFYSSSNERAFPHIDLLTNVSFFYIQNKEIFLTLINKKTNLSNQFIYYLLEDCSKEKKIDKFDIEFIKILLESSLESFKDLEKSDLTSNIRCLIKSISNTYLENIIFLHKIIYNYAQKLNIDLSYTFLEYMNLYKIIYFIKGLELDIDTFIKNDTQYHPMIGNSSEHIMGKELKEKIKAN